MKGKMLLGIIGIASIMFVSSIGMTYAAFIASDSEINEFIDGNVELDIKENFQGTSSWDGLEKTKEVKILNKSNVPALIRVAIIPRWVTNQGSLWPEDTNYAKINFSDNVVVAANNGSDEKWIKDNNEDSKVKYYYYNTILQPNVETKEIINSVTVNIPDEIEKRFRGKKLVIDVKAETVLATEEAYKAAWSDIDNPDISAMLDNLCRN